MDIIGIDLGGTRIKAALVSDDGRTQHPVYIPTNDGDDNIWKTAIKNAVDQLINLSASNHQVVGISAPGLPNINNTQINFMPGRLQGLERFDWSSYLGWPTYILNDAVAALLAEVKYGVAKNKKHVAMLTLGTGVGGALLMDGKPYQGDFCRAGHLGHIVIDQTGDKDITNMPGSLEDCIGNCTIEKRTAGKYKSTHDLVQAFNRGDAFATKIWLTSVRQLALGIASIINVISPELIVIGGGIAEANDLLFMPLNEYMKEYEWRPGGHTVPITKAQQGDMAGTIGAAVFAKSKRI